MKQLWLEKLAEDGLIRKEALAHIYEEVNATVKQAEATFAGMKPEELSHHLKQLLGAGIGLGMLAGGKALFSKMKSMKTVSEGKDMMAKTREMVMKQYKDPEDLAKAQARFDEIARYSPHVAMNAPLASKLVRSNLHSGISDETAQRLAMVQSNYMPDLKEQQAMLPKLGSIRPEVLGEIVADLFIMEKSANVSLKDVGRYLKTVGTYSSIPIVSGLVTGVAAHLWDKAKAKDLKKNLDQSFNTAVKGAPETHKDIFMQDMGKTRDAFNALSHFAPHVALQPHAARTFMKKMLDYYDQGGMNVSDVRELTEIEKNISGAKRPDAFGKAFDAGSRFVSSGPMSKGVEAATSDLMAVADGATHG